MVSQSLFCLHRRMFPAMRVKILGLDPHQQYYIAMDIVPVDNKRYRYVLRSFSPPPHGRPLVSCGRTSVQECNHRNHV